MKRWDMIHKIKILHDNGNGLSIRQIRDQLGISKNTVIKYLKMDEESICKYLSNNEREKRLDKYKEWVLHLLQKFPKLTSVKIARKLKERVTDIDISDRSFRRYVSRLKSENPVKQVRYYEPVIDMIPGVQCQVDGGELRNVMIGGKAITVYFVVFVLSYSRLMYVVTSLSPVTTEIFIRMHDEAFRYFEGVPEECVYDQTKLVVIHEEFREVIHNEAFYQYATASRYDVRVCEGYDPESKGKVESGVKYVKSDFFYGEEFVSHTDLNQRLSTWINDVANCRIHGTTQKVPKEVFENQERHTLKEYLKPTLTSSDTRGEIRKVDKTSLISWGSNKYSVPLPYQSSSVLAVANGGILVVCDKSSGKEIATHKLSMGKGQLIKNRNHYRDYQKPVTEHEEAIHEIIGKEAGEAICSIIKQTVPKIYKDQLVGLRKVLMQHKNQVELGSVIRDLMDRPQLKVSFIRDYLDGYVLATQNQKSDETGRPTACNVNPDLVKYAGIRPDNSPLREDAQHVFI